jgi:hypothetical protein
VLSLILSLKASHFSWELIPLIFQNKILVDLLLSIGKQDGGKQGTIDSPGIQQPVQKTKELRYWKKIGKRRHPEN